MGMYGSYFFIFIRAVVCIIWYGIQSYYAAQLLSVCFRCVFGSSWTSFKNTLPVSAHVAGPILLCFFLVWLIELPFVSPSRPSVKKKSPPNIVRCSSTQQKFTTSSA